MDEVRIGAQVRTPDGHQGVVLPNPAPNGRYRVMAPAGDVVGYYLLSELSVVEAMVVR